MHMDGVGGLCLLEDLDVSVISCLHSQPSYRKSPRLVAFSTWACSLLAPQTFDRTKREIMSFSLALLLVSKSGSLIVWGFGLVFWWA